MPSFSRREFITSRESPRLSDSTIHVAVAKHYVENLKEEVKKGMPEKAEKATILDAGLLGASCFFR
jgi:hypothetical protein